MSKRQLVVLGSSLTALAVVRNANNNNLQPIIIDRQNGIAALSSQAKIIIKQGGSDDQLLSTIVDHGGSQHYLIASSDEWLTFIKRFRSPLEDVYQGLLCPSNSVLDICLDKQKFSIWCEDNQIPAPRIIRWTDQDISKLKYTEPATAFFIRPIQSAAQLQDVPKTITVDNIDALIEQTQRLQQKGVDYIVTESLLSHTLIQYSVPFVRSENGIRLYVAKKIRPLAKMCAVGTYVSLESNTEIEALGRQVADKLDFYGIGEIEILYSQTNQQCYVIEVNARPWIQYHHAVKSGYDLIRYLLDPEKYSTQYEKKSGKHWINFADDVYVCFSGFEGHVRLGELSIWQYVRSLLKANVYATFNWLDMRPFMSNFRYLFKLILGRD